MNLCLQVSSIRQSGRDRDRAREKERDQEKERKRGEEIEGQFAWAASYFFLLIPTIQESLQLKFNYTVLFEIINLI